MRSPVRWKYSDGEKPPRTGRWSKVCLTCKSLKESRGNEPCASCTQHVTGPKPWVECTDNWEPGELYRPKEGNGNGN